jgi:hypothetical protein
VPDTPEGQHLLKQMRGILLAFVVVFTTFAIVITIVLGHLNTSVAKNTNNVHDTKTVIIQARDAANGARADLKAALATASSSNVNNKLNRSDSNSKERTAETRFLLCSRKAELNTFAKASDVDKVCKGYQTLNQAYATERNR